MTAIVVINIKRNLNKNHTISERDARILLATIDAYEKQVEELKVALQTEKSKTAEQAEPQP